VGKARSSVKQLATRDTSRVAGTTTAPVAGSVADVVIGRYATAVTELLRAGQYV
jgi:hypothetical protein